MANTVINTPELLNLDSTTGATVLAKGTVANRPETPTFSLDYLVVAGGGGGTYSTSSGGGAGGLRTSYGSTSGGGAGAEPSLNVASGASFTVTVGAGGPKINASNISSPSRGGNSVFGTITSLGGGIGANGNDSDGIPWKQGGSGTGGTYSSNPGGQGTAGQGFRGGSINGAPNYKAGGSGGAGGVGLDATGSDFSGASGNGGPGLAVNILNATNAATASVGEVSGSDVYYAGGGGGGSDSFRNRPAGSGGLGGGGNGGYYSNGTNGTANTGAGGGGGANRPSTMEGGDGGSGVIILRYPNSVSATVNGATQASGSPFTEGNDKITVLTSGTGTITFTDSTPTNPHEYPINGTLRFNTETNKTEYYDGTGWYEIVDEYASGFIGPATNYFDTKLYTGNGATQCIGGYINGAASFNGSSSKIDLGNNSSNNSSTISVSLWFKTSGHSGSATLINNGGANSGETGYYLGLNSNGTIKFEASTGVINGSTNYADNDWHQIVLTLNNGAYNIYVDGNQTPVLTGSGAFTATATRPTWIGQFSYTVSAIEFFNGSIDQVRIYNVALSSSDVAALNLETAATSTTATFPSGQTAVATYTMDTSANGLLNTQDLSTVNYPAGAGCLALYEMNGNSNDTSGTYNGTPNNITYEGSAFDQAAVFNGSSSYIQTTLTKPAGTTFSFSCWINTPGGVAQHIVGDYNSSIANPTFRIQIPANNTLSVGVGTGTGSVSYVTFPTISGLANTWKNLIITVDGTSVNAYINGVALGTTQTSAQTLGAGAQPYTLGAYRPAAGYQNFSGSIDQVRIFNTALTQAQVTTLARGIATSYSGTATNVNFNGHLDFQPDFVWVKNRTVAVNHYLYDSIRGTGPAKALHSNTTATEASASAYSVNGGIQSIDTNGFTAFAGTDTTYQGTNKSGNDYVSWNWKAGGTAVTNNNGTTSSQVSANKDSGFSIVKYTGNGGSTATTIGHGLSSAPEIIISKDLDSSSYDWAVYTSATGNTQKLALNQLNAQAASGVWNDTSPTNSVFSVRYDQTNATGNDFIAYCWHSVAGYSKIGSYTGNGNATGPIVTTGFEPSWIMIKNITSATAWLIFDSARNPTNSRYNLLQPQDSAAEIDLLNLYSLEGVDFLTNSFQLKDTNASRNALNDNYIYMAFA